MPTRPPKTRAADVAWSPQARRLRLILFTSCLCVFVMIILRIMGEIHASNRYHIRLSTVQAVTESKTNSSRSTGERNRTGLNVMLRFAKRKLVVRKLCASRSRREARLTPMRLQSLYDNLMVNDKLRFIYCYVPKTGVTSWKSALLVLMGQEASVEGIKDVNQRSRYTYLSRYNTNQEKLWRLEHYTKFMVFRDPLERLISAYVDKFASPGINVPFHKTYGRKIISLYRPNATVESLKHGSDVTFPEFVQFVLDGYENAHWMPSSKRCQPCTIGYDYYAATETASEDAGLIFHALGAPESLYLPHANEKKRSTNATKFYSLLRRNQLQQIINLFKDDYLMFGYREPDVDTH